MFCRLHLHNSKLQDDANSTGIKKTKDEATDTPVYVQEFGFHVPTCCGYLPQSNNWCSDWQVCE